MHVHRRLGESSQGKGYCKQPEGRASECRAERHTPGFRTGFVWCAGRLFLGRARGLNAVGKEAEVFGTPAQNERVGQDREEGQDPG